MKVVRAAATSTTKSLASSSVLGSSYVLRQPHPREAILNAIFPDPRKPDEPARRHMAMCRELAELGMKLATAAAHRARRDAADDGARPQSRAAGEPDPVETFVRLTGAVTQAIALEARIAQGQPIPATARSPWTRPRAPTQGPSFLVEFPFSGDDPS
jgi:hypothetical protein